ncbi:MAG: protein-export chaperone SecB [Candidatus Faecousia sp.]|nr:protein-export chaperone SecB [Clostridiales bacterium]MDD7651970.1 protein-export chaperone SecB [Bacillota bacterium]MDY4220147.1 protein-export chaperone SecB [Candidatus Faecousia sp.]
MEKSAFQFTNPRLERLEFVVHEGFQKTGNLNMDIKLSVHTQRFQNSDGTPSNQATVMITLAIGSKDDTSPFYMEADEAANFKWEEAAFDDAQIELLLKQNGAALLVSYLRPILSGITAASPYPAYNLPYLNLTTLQEQ